MNRITKAGLGLLILGAGATTPIVPEDMELLVSYQYPVDSYEEFVKVGYGDTAEIVPNPQKPFKDTDGNGIISVSAFANRKGEAVFVQIDEQRYAEMGGKKEEGKGYARNPRKGELVSLLEKTTPRAEAAIAFDAATTATGSGTSITFAKTVTGSNTTLIVGADSNESSTSSTIISGVTYNSVAMTLLDEQADGLGYYTFFFYLIAPTTGSNNVVVSRSSSGPIMATASSYTGTYQCAYNGVQNAGSATASTINMTITTGTANSWIVASGERHRGWTAGSNTTLRTTEGVGTLSVLDSGGLAGGSGTAGAKQLTVTQSDGTASAWVISELKEASTCPAGADSSYIILFE